jgi:GxxExxY protein
MEFKNESESFKHTELTGEIIKCFYEVYNTLGYGFLEKVYLNAFCYELTQAGFEVESQFGIQVYYKKQSVGIFYADIVVNKTVIVELKTAESLHSAHEAQLTNYLRATQMEVGLLLNFGKEPAISRRVFANSRKKHLKS